MSYKGIGLFTSSPLSAPPSSARKPVASTSRVLLEDSEEEEEHENTVTGGNSTNADDEDAEAEDSSGLAEGEFHVEAILARRGGYNGKRLMYKIRWVRGLADYKTYWLMCCSLTTMQLGFGPEADT